MLLSLLSLPACSSQRSVPRGGSLLGGMDASQAGTGGGYWYRAIRLAELTQADVDALYDALASASPPPAEPMSPGEVQTFGVAALPVPTGPRGRLTADSDGDGLVTYQEVLGMYRTGYTRDDILRALEASSDLYLVLDRRDAQRLIDAGLPAQLITRMRTVSSGQRASLAEPRDAASVDTPF